MPALNQVRGFPIFFDVLGIQTDHDHLTGFSSSLRPRSSPRSGLPLGVYSLALELGGITGRV